MPRAKGGVNKSEVIRTLLRENRKMHTKDIVKLMADKGHKVSPNLVYLVKAKMRYKRRKQKRADVLAAGKQAGITNPVQLILKVKLLANEAGGIKHLKQLVYALAE